MYTTVINVHIVEEQVQKTSGRGIVIILDFIDERVKILRRENLRFSL